MYLLLIFERSNFFYIQYIFPFRHIHPKKHTSVLLFVSRNLGGNVITGNIPHSLKELTNLTEL